MDYILMHKRKKTARVSLDETEGYIREIYDVYAPEHIPVGAAGPEGTLDRAGLSRWWHRRAIPASRTGLREAFAIMDIDSPEYLLEKCWGLSLSDQMLTVDFIIANEDRHTNNFGVIRNAETLEYMGMAPVYDNGTSLWLNTRTDKIRPLSPKLPSKPFKPTHHEQIKLVRSFEWMELERLDGIEEECTAVLAGSEYIDEERRRAICDGIRERIGLLGELAGEI